jgi:hypothetical protein
MTSTAPDTDSRPDLAPDRDLLLRPHRPEAVGRLDAPQTAQLRRALAQLAALRHPNLAPVHSVSQEGVRFVLEHSVPPGAASWSQLCAQRPATAGEAAAVGLAVAAALTALHDADLAHGSVTGQHVLVGQDGSIVLGSCGTAWRAAPGQSGRSGVGPSPADDVQALAALIQDSFDPGTIGAELALLLIRSGDVDPKLRPGIAEVAVVLRTVAADVVDPAAFVTAAGRQEDLVGVAEPGAGAQGPTSAGRYRLAETSTAPEPTPAQADGPIPARATVAGRRVGSRQLLLAAALVTIALLVARVAIAVAGHSSGPTPPGSPLPVGATPVPVSSSQWGHIVTTLDAARTAAMRSGSPARLAAVDDPAGPAYANDLVVVRARTAAGLTVVGGRLAVRTVTALEHSNGRALLAVTDVRGAYTLRAAGGHTVLTEPARPLATWRLELVADSLAPGGWRVFSVARQ